jgi:hypothetical protein
MRDSQCRERGDAPKARVRDQDPHDRAQLTQVERVPDDPIWAAGHHHAGIGQDAKASPQAAERAERQGQRTSISATAAIAAASVYAAERRRAYQVL